MMKENYLDTFVLSLLVFWTFWTVCPVELVQGKSVERVREKVKVYTCITSKYFMSQHSLVKSYHENGTAGWDIPNWDYEGNTIITNDFVRLTSTQPGQYGLLTNKEVITMKNWEIQFQLKVQSLKHKKEGRKITSNGNNGIGFWYTKEKLKRGALFGARNNFNGFSIVIEDSTEIPKYSHIYLMVNNGNENFTNSSKNSNSNSECLTKLKDTEHETWIKIVYDHHNLNVFMDVDGTDQWKLCLTSDNLLLPTNNYLGVSASNGDLATNSHDLITIKTYKIEYESEINPNFESDEGDPCYVEVTKDVESILMMAPAKPPALTFEVFFLPLIVFFVMVALCAAGTQMYPNPRDVPLNMPTRFQ